MMVEIGWVMFASVCMALLTAGLATLFPASFRPWWHAERRAEPAVADDLAMAAPKPAVTLTVVDAIDRRATPLAFVGKDRRKAARAVAKNDVRRRGNGH